MSNIPEPRKPCSRNLEQVGGRIYRKSHSISHVGSEIGDSVVFGKKEVWKAGGVLYGIT